MTYTPDILIKADEFNVAFKNKYGKNIDCCCANDIENIVKLKLMKTKEFKLLDELYVKKQEIFSVDRLKIDKIKELTEEEKQKIVHDRLSTNKKYQDTIDEILKLEKKLKEAILESDDYRIWAKMSCEKIDDAYIIENEKYYWISFGLSCYSKIIINWCYENDVTYIVRS